jgi:hypothetical protein
MNQTRVMELTAGDLLDVLSDRLTVLDPRSAIAKRNALSSPLF